MAADFEPAIPGCIEDDDDDDDDIQVLTHHHPSQSFAIPDVTRLKFNHSSSMQSDHEHFHPTPECSLPVSTRLTHMEEVLDRVELQLQRLTGMSKQLSSLQEVPHKLNTMFDMVSSIHELSAETVNLTSWVATDLDASHHSTPTVSRKGSRASFSNAPFSGNGTNVSRSGTRSLGLRASNALSNRASVVSQLRHSSISSARGLDRASVVSMASNRDMIPRLSNVSQSGFDTALTPILPVERQVSPSGFTNEVKRPAAVSNRNTTNSTDSAAMFAPPSKSPTDHNMGCSRSTVSNQSTSSRKNSTDSAPSTQPSISAKKDKSISFTPDSIQSMEVRNSISEDREWFDPEQFDCGDESWSSGGRSSGSSVAAASSKVAAASPKSQGLARMTTLDLTRHRDDVLRKVVHVHSGSEQQQSMSLRCVLSPISTRRLIWDAVIVTITVMSGLITPMVLVYFERDRDSINGMDVLLYMFDFFWVLDVIMNFRTGFFVDGHVVDDAGLIAQHYTRGWLFPDLLAMWPLCLMLKDSTGYVVACFMKSFRVLQLGPRMQALQSGTLSDRLLPVGIGVASSLGIHFLACMWRGVLNWDERTCLFYCLMEDHTEPWTTKYMKDMYFVIMTITSVGYGDIIPASNISRGMTIFFMLLGSAVFGACISGCSIVFSSLIEDEVSNKTAEITRFMGRRNVDHNMQRRVRDNLRQCLSSAHNCSMVPVHILECLSPAMRRELCLCLVSDTFFHFPLFRSTQHSFLADLAQAQHWQQILPGDLVADHGQSVQEIIFVMAGELHAVIDAAAEGQLDVPITRQDNIDTNISSVLDDDDMHLPAGSWIGEVSLLSHDRIYSAIITAVLKSELSILSGCEYERIVQSFPRLLERHIRMKRSIAAGNMDYSSLRYKEEVYGFGSRKDSLAAGFVHKLTERFFKTVSPQRSPSQDPGGRQSVIAASQANRAAAQR